MAFIVGAIIGAGAAVAGGAIAAKGAKSAAKTAAAGSDREIEFNRESRDLARADQAPYREAGVKALDALMSMTGLGGGVMGGPAKAVGPANAAMPVSAAPGGREFDETHRGSSYGIRSGTDPDLIRLRYAGGPVGGVNYNINELGPENLYRDGSYTRNPNPATIDGRTGYVEPHTVGRAEGGVIGGAYDNNRGYIKTGVQNPNANRIPNQTGGVLGGFGQSVVNYMNNGQPTGTVKENPGGVEGGYNFMTDPGYGFRSSEGNRAITASAAARGGLLSGGTGKALQRYGQDYASNEYTNVYNRISNIAGLGQVGATQSGNAALQAGAYMGNAASNAGNASAYGQLDAGNAWANAANQIAQLPWGQMGGGGQPSLRAQTGNFVR